jgi:hypothetical protein
MPADVLPEPVTKIGISSKGHDMMDPSMIAY